MIGVLIEAKKKGYIQSVKPYFDRLRNSGFRMSEEVYRLGLQMANESQQNIK
jgi:predicted nucleic acid-binding protein